MKLGFPKSRLGRIFVIIYIVGFFVMIPVVGLCYYDVNISLCNFGFLLLAPINLPIRFFNYLIPRFDNAFEPHGSTGSLFVQVYVFRQILTILFGGITYYWLGKGIEKLYHKIKSSKAKGKK